MRILWLCNIALPVVAEKIGLPISNKEGWLTGLADTIMEKKEENLIELGVCFPIAEKGKLKKGMAEGIAYYGFYENTAKETEYADTLDADMKAILEDFRPEVVHIFGTEFAHSLAMVKSVEMPKKLLVGIQGVCSVCAKHYADGVPKNVQKRFLLRDFLKQDNIAQQQKKFFQRGDRENEILRSVGNITGRTKFDRKITSDINGSANYYFMNETLRSNFYKESWVFEECEKYTLFMSQGDYPLKGLHRVIEALTQVRKKYPQVRLRVAGNKITAHESLYQKIKLSSYGKYILDLIKRNNLEGYIEFLGMLNAQEMCSELKKANIFLNASSVENSPNSLGEAMLLGMPCIASEVGGVPSMLTHEKEGYLYPAHDTNKLADYIMKIFEDKDTARNISDAARERALNTHNAQKNYETLIGIYEDISGASNL